MKTEIQLDIIQRIKTHRQEKNISQCYIAKLLELCPGQIGNIESIKRPHKYTLKQIVAICNEFEIAIENIFFPKINKNQVNKEMLVEVIIKYQE